MVARQYWRLRCHVQERRCLRIHGRWVQQSSISPNFGIGISGDRPTRQVHAPCINIPLFRQPFPYSIEQRVNPYSNSEDADYGMWEKALDVGRSYLVGATVRCPSFDMSTRRL
jgi:hypothetical protein